LNPSAVDVANALSAIAARRVGDVDCDCSAVSVGTSGESVWITYRYRARLGVFGFRCEVVTAVRLYDSSEAAELADLIWFGEIEAPPPDQLVEADGVMWWGDGPTS
jgi:hypothetical protein